MKLIETNSLKLPEVLTVKFGRFSDDRGYFTETFRKSDFKEIEAFKNVEFVQCNESFSRKNVFRGLHFQWNPYMGKLVRCISGILIDFAMDIRVSSPNFGKIIGYDLPSTQENDFNEWIWIPPGFAHGVLLTEDSLIEYFCSGEYSPGCEASISPLSEDIDWSLCDPDIKATFDSIVPTTDLITDKDKGGLTVAQWLSDDRSKNFIYGEI